MACTQLLLNSLIHKSFLWFQHKYLWYKSIAWYKSHRVNQGEQVLIKTDKKTIQNYQSKTMFLFKMYTLEFEFDWHLEHMVSYQGLQSRLLVFLVGEFGTFEIFMQNDCLIKPDLSYFFNYKHQKQIIFGQNMTIPSYLLITNQLYFDSGLFIKLKT